ncbi:hypothetical protein [Nocardioides sp.]|uniref:hypothetical protein n=1 Tax=Nocardioides sp. TaxID=35761 RepID=UPI0035298B82
MALLTLPLAMSLVSPASAEAVLTVTPTAAIGPVAVGASPTASFTIDPDPGGEPVHLDWTVRSGTLETDPVVRSGSADVTPDVDGVVSLTFDTPTELGEGTYGLEVVASDDVPGTGPATGTSGIIDVVVLSPPTVSVSTKIRKFFPYHDNFQDSLRYRVTSTGRARVQVTVREASGSEVFMVASVFLTAGASRTLTWGGGLPGAGQAPAGRYVVSATATDPAGSVATADMTVVLSRAKLRFGDKTVTRLPTKTIVGRSVGRCSSLRTPSSHGWRGSQGYYSRSRCASSANHADVVLGQHAIWLPRAVHDDYHYLTVWLYGGKAKGARSAYMILTNLDKRGRVYGSEQLSASLGWHRGQPVYGPEVVRKASGRPYLSWVTGLAQGSRYDVKKFKITVERQVLRNPDGSIEWPATGGAAGTSEPVASAPALDPRTYLP